MAGYVYAFASPSMPGVVKIGATAHDPAARLAEANSADTWRPPLPYELVCSAHGAHELRPRSRRSARSTRSSARVASTRAASSSAPVSSRARSLFALLVDEQAAGESPADETSAGSSPVRVRAGPSLRAGGAPWQSQLLQETCLRAWVESKYIHVPLREKDTGSKLEALYAMYASCVPPVHSKALGRNTFGKMLNSIYRGVGPHRGAAGETGKYLLR